MVPGNQKVIVPRETFLRANGILKQNAQGYTVKEENVDIPLKHFVSCAICGRPLRGYILKKKNLYYYECNTKSYCNNKSANKNFSDILDYFKINLASDALKALRPQVIATFNLFTIGKQLTYQELTKEHKELQKKIDRLEERYVEEEIAAGLFYKYKAKYEEEKLQIEDDLIRLSSQVSNLGKVVGTAIKFCTDIPKKWLSADYNTKQQLQQLIFPTGITYSKKTDECRTSRINQVFLYLAYFQQIISNKKRGIPELMLDYASFATLVARRGKISNHFFKDLQSLADK